MTKRRPCPPAPGPLEGYAARFDGLLGSLAQRRNFRTYLQGLLLPRDRNKTLTALVGTEPIVGAQAAPVQRLQWYLSESAWDVTAVNRQRLALLCATPATRPHAAGVLVLDDTGDRKAGTKTAHVARQDLGSLVLVSGAKCTRRYPRAQPVVCHGHSRHQMLEPGLVLHQKLVLQP